MYKFAEFIARNPKLVGVFVAVLGAGFAWNSFQIGMSTQRIRDLVAESAREASEALGG
jgi:hypothetical protein